MLHAALVELEGVVVETASARRAALARALADDGLALDEATVAALAADVAVDAAVAAAHARATTAPRALPVLDATARELATLRAERYFAERLGRGVTLAPGAVEALAALGTRLRLALVTRLRRRETELVLSLAGLDATFETIVTADDVRAPKPDPAGHRRALERLARRRPLDAHDVVAFEDALSGVVGARRAGVVPVLVGADASVPLGPEGAAARLPALRGLTVASLAALLDREGEPSPPHPIR